MMLALFRTEMAKQWRRPRTYIALGIFIVIPLIVGIALKSNPPSPSPQLASGDDAYPFLTTKTGLFLGVTSLFFLSRFLLVVVLAVFAGDAVASEASWGNLRALLVRPIPRSRLLAAKLAVAALFGAVATMLVSLTGLVFGGLLFGWHPLNVAGTLHQSTGHIVASLGISTAYVFWSLTPIIAFAFMVSTMTDTPASAIFSAVGLYIVSQILDGITAIGSIRNVFPTHYFDAWTSLVTANTGPTNEMLRGTLLVVPYAIAFLAVAWWWFRRKDILT